MDNKKTVIAQLISDIENKGSQERASGETLALELFKKAYELLFKQKYISDELIEKAVEEEITDSDEN